MCIKYHNNSQQEVTSYKNFEKLLKADDELALLKYTIMTGWPNNIKEIPLILQPYWTLWEELTIEDGLILKGTRIVIPSKKWEAILNQIHDSLLGLKKCKLWAKQTVYWPGLNDQLQKLVLNCLICLKYSKSKKKQETSLSLGQEVPIFPWTKLATDLFHFEGNSYLLIIDYTRQFPIMCKLTSMTGHNVAEHFKPNLCWIWVARYNNIWQWTVLHQSNLQKG